MRIVECVPNISEGRDRAIIDAVASVVEQVDGCKLLDVDPGAATNRTVITFVGPVISMRSVFTMPLRRQLMTASAG